MARNNLHILQIGAGSMGTRRLRDLSHRDDVKLAVYDSRSDRRTDAASNFRIPTFATLEEALAWQPQAVCISTPPDAHGPFVQLAVERGLHHFCEANIWTPNWWQIEHRSQQRGLISAPSCSFYFHPLIAKLKELVAQSLGKLHAWQVCLSTYMPDWHPAEGDEYYARHRSTAAAREMVPFELLWLNDVFGVPNKVSGVVSQHAYILNGMEDGWYLQLELPGGGTGQFSVLMGCPVSRRRGVCLGERGLIEFDIVNGRLYYQLQDRNEAVLEFAPQAQVLETAYQREINSFVDAIHGTTTWPLSYRQASLATATLAAAELSSLSTVKERIDPDRQPAGVPTDYDIDRHDLDMTVRHGPRRPISVRPASAREPS